MDPSSRVFDRWKASLVTAEAALLKELGFDLYSVMSHPHNFLLYYIRLLRGSTDVAQRAWGYLNDALRLDLCVRFGPEVIACAAIAMAAEDDAVGLPDSPPWHVLLCPGATAQQLRDIASEIRWLYAVPRSVFIMVLSFHYSVSASHGCPHAS